MSEFRSRLVENSAEALLLETILISVARKHGWKARGKQRTDSTHVLAAVRSLNRYELLGDVPAPCPEYRRHYLSPVIAGAGICRVAQALTDASKAQLLPKSKAARQAWAIRSAPMA
ncbi:MAG: hypothetical protein R2932_43055 [Caldilineaceae bacterium]